MVEIQDYKKYRWFFTSSNKLVIGGKSAQQNDELIERMKRMNHEFIVMHTKEPGSPFAFIISQSSKVSEKDITECSIFTASFSKAWKLGKKNAKVDIFNLSQLSKSRIMKTGTWGVSGKVREINAELRLVLTFQSGSLRAVPEESVKNKKEILTIISPGKIVKSDMPAKLDLELDKEFSQEEILSALPAGGFKIIR